MAINSKRKVATLAQIEAKKPKLSNFKEYSSAAVSCPVCKSNLDTVPPESRNNHVNACLDKIGFQSVMGGARLKQASITSFFQPKTSIHAISTTSIEKENSPAVSNTHESTKISVNFPDLQKDHSQGTNIERESTTVLPQFFAKIDDSKFLQVEQENNSFFTSVSKKNTVRSTIQIAPKESKSAKVPQTNKKQANVKQCPFYKRVEGIIKRISSDINRKGTDFVVDAFSYGAIPGCNGYFLTHFHSDHYGGISKNFDHGTIYCTSITANLLEIQYKIPRERMYILKECGTDVIGNVTVTTFPANHCPGAIMILFDTGAKRILHSGDFRANKELCELFQSISLSKVDVLHLDTTYCGEKHVFPDQDEVIQTVSNAAEKFAKEFSLPLESGLSKITHWLLPKLMSPKRKMPNKKALIVVGSYLIGKEKIAVAIARRLNTKIYANPQKLRILKLLEWPELNDMLTNNPAEAQVHMSSMQNISLEKLAIYLAENMQFTEILGIRPTGWSFGSDRKADSAPYIKNGVGIMSVPYSEHSSFLELKSFVQTLKPSKIIPMVNLGPAKREQMTKIFDGWLSECI